MKKILNPRALAGGVMVLMILTFTPASALTSATYESETIRWTNIKREAHDKHPVKAQSCADRYAEKQAAWLASHRKLKHQNLGTILDACDFTSVSENIAYGFSTGRAVVTAWMNSPGHRANLLKGSMRWIGVGAVKDENGVWWVSQVFGTR